MPDSDDQHDATLLPRAATVNPAAVEARNIAKISILDLGGIQNAADAIGFMMAGATAVAVGTANFYEPQTALQVVAGLREFIRQN